MPPEHSPPRTDDEQPDTWPSFGFSKLVGIPDFDLHDDGSVTTEMDVDDHHRNQGGLVHGGMLFTLLDSVMGGAVVRTLQDDEWCATETINVQFMRPAEGRVRARGWLERRGRLTAFVTGEVQDVASGKVVARATGVWVVRSG